MRGTMCTIVCLAIVAIGCGDDGNGSGNDGNWKNKIICEAKNASNYDIYIMNEDGSEMKNLTNTPTQDERAPRWSPDGVKNYFQKKEADNKYYLYSMFNDGSGQTKISNTPVKDFQFDISSDCSKIAFVGTDQYDIYVVNVDGTSLTKLTNNPQNDACPSWSPDGNWIAFVSNETGTYKLYKMKADGTEQTPLCTYGDLLEYQPQWSPDGTKIAFTRWGNFWGTDNAELFIIKNGETNPVNISNNGNNDWYPVWSPNGSSIIFMSDRDGDREIYVWRNNNVTNLTNYNVYDEDYHSFSPDGSKIVFTSTRDSINQQIYIMNADGSNQTRLTFDTTLRFYSPRMVTVLE